MDKPVLEARSSGQKCNLDPPPRWCSPGNSLLDKLSTILPIGYLPNSNSVLRVLQWNAGRLSNSKKTELCKTPISHDINVFSIVEANLTQDNIRFPSLAGYSLQQNKCIRNKIL
ncbi:hypothetical protein TNCV_3136321 [Trichonephila clavipes]|nr:hypothetical protein TNCV_3136321 [Trichonephila clavipes]